MLQSCLHVCSFESRVLGTPIESAVKMSSALVPLQVLWGASGEALPGELVGLLGPSGAGKSSMLEILAGRKSTGAVTGTVLCNGLPLGPSFKRLSCYVPQEDVFVPVSPGPSCLAPLHDCIVVQTWPWANPGDTTTFRAAQLQKAKPESCCTVSFQGPSHDLSSSHTPGLVPESYIALVCCAGAVCVGDAALCSTAEPAL